MVSQVADIIVLMLENSRLNQSSRFFVIFYFLLFFFHFLFFVFSSLRPFVFQSAKDKLPARIGRGEQTARACSG
jgi:hypothetical protein